MDNETHERLIRLQNGLSVVKLLLALLIVCVVVHFWGVAKPAQVGFLVVCGLVFLWGVSEYSCISCERNPVGGVPSKT